ncbi:membrane fusion protein, multidrug efflux system [Arboricoccus pini]|uniref:Membrane fusion protein, multidrug efflux system n=1 Tax=Arboricoccus pini TaxID=1963835 RepID=A0A212R8A8_9PROT|nr:efflux RND transporter periplasmic adaptor subunit [Arboricoccus pini]SNB68392.1 membrane fusion protein, multidrug efflux system [Arboricoccus pini]
MRKRWILISLLVVVLAGAGWYFWRRHETAGQHDAQATSSTIVPVLTARVQQANVPVYLEGVGTVQAYQSVLVQPQIDGRLLELRFREGQDIKKGDLLALIDPALYQAQLDEAIGKMGQDYAQLANARLDAARYQRLAKTDYATKQEADTAAAQVRQYTALVQSDQAAIDSARTSLGYTRITSPIDGRTGIRKVDVGNIVRASDTTGIVTITQLRPISVLFTLPETQLSSLGNAMAAGVPLAAQAFRSGADEPLDRGSLEVVDNEVDTTTGTIKLKATFPNAELQLWPGQFVNVRLQIDTRKDALTIPAAAVQQGPDGTFAYVVERQGDTATVARLKSIQVAQEDEKRAVVTSGLSAEDEVITTGFVRLTDGEAVRIDRSTAGDAGAAGSRAASGS